jgi:hypothetical protein
LADPQSVECERFGGLQDLDVVLVLARRLDHLDELCRAIDRRFPDITIAIGQRVVGVVPLGRAVRLRR